LSLQKRQLFRRPGAIEEPGRLREELWVFGCAIGFS
jgi:hypothetical protein